MVERDFITDRNLKILISTLLLLLSQTASADSAAHNFFPQKNIAHDFFNEKKEAIPSESDTVTNSLSKDDVRQKVIEEFGDPNLPHPVKPVDDAPDPYKGMLKAIELGDDKLAYAYAKQYEKYVDDLKGVADKAVALGHLAKKEMGTLPPNGNANEEKYAELEASIGLADEKEAAAQRQNELNEQALALLRKAKKSPYDLEAGSYEDTQTQAQIDRLTARQDLTGKLPFVPSGQIDLLFFFKPYQKESVSFGKYVNKFFLTTKDEDEIAVIGFSVKGYNGVELNSFKQETNAKFNLTGGQTIASKMQIVETPTLVIVDAKTKKFHKITKIVSADYLAEAIKIVRGQK